MRRRITEYLEIDTDAERWHCVRCGHDLGDARSNYKHGCLVWERDPREVHRPIIEGTYTFAPDPSWCRILEFICPGCAALVEVEYRMMSASASRPSVLRPSRPAASSIARDIPWARSNGVVRALHHTSRSSLRT